MIIGIGVDITEVARMALAIERRGERFVQRVFTEAEIRYCRSRKNVMERFAGRFAAKEAAMKAIGTGWRRGVSWRDFEVTRESSGRPVMRLSGRAEEIARELGGKQALVTISHTEQQAIAWVVLEG